MLWILPFSAVAVGVSPELDPDATRPSRRAPLPYSSVPLPCRFGSEPEGLSPVPVAGRVTAEGWREDCLGRLSDGKAAWFRP